MYVNYVLCVCVCCTFMNIKCTCFMHFLVCNAYLHKCVYIICMYKSVHNMHVHKCMCESVCVCTYVFMVGVYVYIATCVHVYVHVCV